MGFLTGGKLKLNYSKTKRDNLLKVFCKTDILIDCIIKFFLKPYEFGDVIPISRYENDSSQTLSNLPKTILVVGGQP